MAGRINDEDVQAVRERARIEEIVAAYVSLKRAGSGGLMGLCPFHDEKTPSFHVAPTRGFFHCFGCGEGGDVITFVQKIENLSFVEAIEHLADKVGIQLRYEEGSGPRIEPGLRTRILAANQEAADFYASALLSEEALPGRQMLADRGFSREAAETFGVGWAPRGDGKVLAAHLERRGFRRDELVKAGLIRSQGWDFFQGRLVWPIRDSGTNVVGFGARRIFDDDRMPAKYLNTPETPVYKKSQVLYGLDLARRKIGARSQAVVVEGYTDVMACHLAGIDTAVASCGTAFGPDHARMLQRLMGTDVQGTGEVVFTFDGDEAGQAAALKVFDLDTAFTAQTYVAVDPGGADPCDIRIQRGDEAVRDLIGSRVPLYRFVMANIVGSFDLDRADARLNALRAAAPLVSSVRDKALVGQYTRELAGLVGMSMEDVATEVKRARSRRPDDQRTPVRPVAEEEPAPQRAFPRPDPHDRTLRVERDCTKLLLQAPGAFTEDFNGLSADDFRHPGYRAVWEAVLLAAPLGRHDGWDDRVRAAAVSPEAAELVVEVAVEPLLRAADPGYVDEYAASLQLIRTRAHIDDIKSRLQRTNPVDNEAEYHRTFASLVELERRKKDLEQRSWGGSGAV